MVQMDLRYNLEVEMIRHVDKLDIVGRKSKVLTQTCKICDVRYTSGEVKLGVQKCWRGRFRLTYSMWS